MNQFHIKYITSIVIFFIGVSMSLAQPILVDSQSSFDDALDSASSGDSIIWKAGTYSDIFMEIEKSNLYIGAEVPGETIFTGFSRAFISGNRIKMKGFQYLGGDIGTKHVIETRGSHNHFSQINIDGYTSYKYFIIKEECQFDTVSYCNFENRLNLDDQNILSVLVDKNNPGYHLIHHCSFKNFDGTGNDLGIEPIRIGVSTQAEYDSRTIVEYCYFTHCDGDGEIISNKAGQNIFRYNTFEDNPKAELVLRHGDQGVVYGNFFLNNYGGVRVREGQGHIIFNNYFHTTSSRTIYLQNEDSDPLKNITVAFNTIINCEEVRLGGNGNDKPQNVTFANNIFVQPKDDLFEDPTGTETWISNISMGSLGMSRPQGIVEADPLLVINDEGYYELSESSPAIDAASAGYSSLPEFMGIEYDHKIELDLMQQDRPDDASLKDIGCLEYPHEKTVQPFATSKNTGPSYLQDNSTSSVEIKSVLPFKLYPNPAHDQLQIELKSPGVGLIEINLANVNGRKIKTIASNAIQAGDIISEDISDLLPGLYIVSLKIKKDATDKWRSTSALFFKQ